MSAECMASGSPPLVFRWTKDGQELLSDSRLNIRSDAEYSTVEIRKPQPDDRGNYTCFASNGFGSDSYSALLKIKRERLLCKSFATKLPLTQSLQS